MKTILSLAFAQDQYNFDEEIDGISRILLASCENLLTKALVSSSLLLKFGISRFIEKPNRNEKYIHAENGANRGTLFTIAISWENPEYRG